jgi:hypothetical protein
MANLITVLMATPVKRLVARIEFPSIKQAITRQRVSVVARFILTIILEHILLKMVRTA